jgi:hypothetical protein
MKEYTLTEEELQELFDAAKPVPYMIIGGNPPPSSYNRSLSVWKRVAERVNCDVNTIQGSDPKNPHLFKAKSLD